MQQIVFQTGGGQDQDATIPEDNDPIAPMSNLNVKEIVHQLGARVGNIWFSGTNKRTRKRKHRVGNKSIEKGAGKILQC